MGHSLPPTAGRLAGVRETLRRAVRGLLALGACLVLQAQAPRHLVVASSVHNPPYEYLDGKGQPAGFVNDLIRAVAEVEGMDVEIRSMNFAQAREAFDRGEVQVLSGVVFSEERAKSMDFSVPHSFVPYVLLTRQGESQIRSERDCAGKDVLVLERSIMAEHLASLGIPYRQMPTHEASILELASGRGDAALVPKFMYLYFVKHRGIRNLQAVSSEIYPTKRCFAVHKGDHQLLATLNAGLFLLKQNGTLDRLYQHHLGALAASDLPRSLVMRRALWILAPVILGLGIAGLLAWSFSLKHLVRLRTTELDERNRQLEALVGELKVALAEVNQLSGMIPICAHCKKIRNDEGYWQAVETYISKHSEAEFTHGLCPECAQLYFPGVQLPGDPGADAAGEQG